MLFKDIDLLDENLDYKAHQWVGVKDGRIDYIGDKAPADADAYGEAYDGAGRLLLPAFYNAHAHAPMTLLRGFAENLPLQAWLETAVRRQDDARGQLLGHASGLRRDGALRLRELL